MAKTETKEHIIKSNYMKPGSVAAIIEAKAKLSIKVNFV